MASSLATRFGRCAVSQPLLSVVVPCRLAGDLGREMRGAFLRLCLVALDRQTVPGDVFEVVVVDDASDVDLRSLIGDLEPSLRIRPRFVRNDGPPLGVSGAFNRGIHEARGRYVLLATDDSLLAPDAVEAHLAGQRAHRAPAYLCGIERLYVYGVLFRDIVRGTLHPQGDLAVRTFGTLLGFADIQRVAEHLGFTAWTITPEAVRSDFATIARMSSLTPAFRDMYEELESERANLRWLCVRMGNHSVPRSTLLDVGGVEESLPGSNSDQDLGLKLLEAGVAIVFEPGAVSVLIEHRRNVRGFADETGLERLSQRWPRPEVQRLDEYFLRGYERSLADYRRALLAAP